MSIVNDIDEYELSKLEENIRKIDCVTEVMSVNDLTGTSIPTQILPKKFLDRVAKGDNKLDRKSTRLNSSHIATSRMPSSA